MIHTIKTEIQGTVNTAFGQESPIPATRRTAVDHTIEIEHAELWDYILSQIEVVPPVPDNPTISMYVGQQRRSLVIRWEEKENANT